MLSNMMLEEFDPRNITQAHMDKLATCFRTYLDFLEECVVIQDNAPKGTEEAVQEGIKRVQKLIKRLEKGDRSVFKDEDDWNPLG